MEITDKIKEVLSEDRRNGPNVMSLRDYMTDFEDLLPLIEMIMDWEEESSYPDKIKISRLKYLMQKIDSARTVLGKLLTAETEDNS